ncbi:MAG: hypothetical protein MZW92_01800 [Comamonadaceae bacterium]|nr:hypothetical protein [Comamonadaceae bacterium]
MEAEHEQVSAQLSDPVFYRDSPQRAPELKARLQSLQQEIEAAMARWEELERRSG